MIATFECQFVMPVVIGRRTRLITFTRAIVILIVKDPPAFQRLVGSVLGAVDILVQIKIAADKRHVPVAEIVCARLLSLADGQFDGLRTGGGRQPTRTLYFADDIVAG